MNYYKCTELSERIYRIIDITKTCFYLVIGDERACLLDTGNGIGDLKKYVERMTNLPIFVILSHGHLDHVGGAGQFDEVYLNHKDLAIFRKHSKMEYRIAAAQRMGNDIDVNELVPEYTGEIKDIKDGDIFDLGGVTIKMIAVKGHTPGMMCPLILEERTIIFGDACGVGVLLFDENSSCVSEYRDSLLYLKEYENEYNMIYRNHGLFFSTKRLLDNVIECCELILNNQDDRVPVVVHGYELYACKELNESGDGRKDGGEGNILYSKDKIK